MNISGVGEMGVGETGVGEMGQIIGETGVGEMGTSQYNSNLTFLLHSGWLFGRLYVPYVCFHIFS